VGWPRILRATPIQLFWRIETMAPRSACGGLARSAPMVFDGVAESGPVMGCRQPQRLAPAVVALASMYSNIWQIRVGPKSGNCRQFVLDIRAGRASIPREFALASACGTKWMGISL
jgi:hypothetical protein